MNYQVDRTAQLADAHTKSRFGQKASLQAAGVPAKQHNVKTKKKAKSAKKSAAKKVAKKSTVKAVAKKVAKKS